MSSSVAVRAGNRSALALVVAGVLWGTGGLAGSVLAEKADLSPFSVAAYRLLLGGGLAVLFLLCSGRLRGFRANGPIARRLLVSGLLLGFFQASYFAAVALSSVSIATMTTIGSLPVFVALATAVAERRLPTGPTLVSIVVAVAGLVLLRWSPDESVDGWRLTGGLLFALLAGAGFATLTLISGRPVDGLDSWRTNAFGLLIGGLALLPAALWSGMALPMKLDALAAAAYFGAVPTALAYGAYFVGLKGSRPILTALSALLEPLTAALLSALLLGDRLGVTGWCGAALLAGALAVSYLRSAGD